LQQTGWPEDFLCFNISEAGAAAERGRSADEKGSGVAMANPEGMPEHSRESGGEPQPLREALDKAKSVFWCNSNRGAEPGGNELERRMRLRGFAAAWLPFVYPEHMRRARRGDAIFMYANGLGIIGIGYATESRVEILGPDHPDRLRAFGDGEHEEEWRIPVEWRVWDEGNPCEVETLRQTFVDITNHQSRINAVRNHFLGNLET
jgi:hypothetical protein